MEKKTVKVIIPAVDDSAWTIFRGIAKSKGVTVSKLLSEALADYNQRFFGKKKSI